MRPPPTLRLPTSRVSDPNLDLWLRAFEAGLYRASLEPLEAWWFPRRDDFSRGLIHLTVAMNQLATTDLTTSPRGLLISARKLLKPFLPAHEGVDVDAARRLAERELRRLRRKRS